MVIFVDDILIYSHDEETHTLHMKAMLNILRQHQLYTKFSKCEFWLSEVMFLSHLISREDIRVDPAKVEVVNNWERSKTVTEITSFLGLTGYYRRFIKDCSSIASSLTS